MQCVITSVGTLTVCIANPHFNISPRTELTGARALENSSEYDFSGKGSSSANAGETAPIPAPATPAGGKVIPPMNTTGMRIAAKAIFASVCFNGDALDIGAQLWSASGGLPLSSRRLGAWENVMGGKCTMHRKKLQQCGMRGTGESRPSLINRFTYELGQEWGAF